MNRKLEKEELNTAKSTLAANHEFTFSFNLSKFLDFIEERNFYGIHSKRCNK